MFFCDLLSHPTARFATRASKPEPVVDDLSVVSRQLPVCERFWAFLFALVVGRVCDHFPHVAPCRPRGASAVSRSFLDALLARDALF